jgi:hypothetical protein
LVGGKLPASHRRFLIDTRVWIYHCEEHPQLGAPADRVIEKLDEGKSRGVASELTVLELTVQPLRLGLQDAADDYEVRLDYFPNSAAGGSPLHPHRIGALVRPIAWIRWRSPRMSPCFAERLPPLFRLRFYLRSVLRQ